MGILLEQHIAKINDALEKSHTIVIGADCEVTYSGRAESFLASGDRVILIKADKTLLVHQPEGNNPINHLKDNAVHKIVSGNDGVYIKSKNASKEYLDIKLNKIHFVNNKAFEDKQKILVKGTERDMADMIYNNPKLIEEGFKPINQEEQTKYGFIDVFGRDSEGTLVIVECKRQAADFKAVDQLRRYIERMKKSKDIKDKKIRGIIAAPKITTNAKKMLEDWKYEFRPINPPSYLERHDKNQKRLGEF